VILRHIPELSSDSRTVTGLPVQVQLLGGDAGRLAETALRCVALGALGIDLNFGCPARTVNRHDGGATLLKFPERIRGIVSAVRAAVPMAIPVSAKLRLGWDTIDAIDTNAIMAAEAGATWITIHARTRMQGYQPPVYWPKIGGIRDRLKIPVVANGDIWSVDDFRRCREETGCHHFMLGRGSLANPGLVHEIARELGLPSQCHRHSWLELMQELLTASRAMHESRPNQCLQRMKQWLRFAAEHGDFDRFDLVKTARTVDELLANLDGPATVFSG
jgi:tRNA-dihydrouridine synthase C